MRSIEPVAIIKSSMINLEVGKGVTPVLIDTEPLQTVPT